jgi:Protein of unknown function (DUF3618)
MTAQEPGALVAAAPSAPHHHAGDGSPESIAAEIEATREEMAAIIAALERRLSPQQLLERGLDMLKEKVDGSGGAVSETLRRHPLALALVGVGIGWIAFTAAGGTRGRPAEAVREAARRYPTDLAGYAHAREKAGGAMDRAQEAASGTVSQAREGAQTAWRQASTFAEQAADRMTQPRRRVGALMADYPLVLGAVGLLAGAAVALLLPRSAAEERWVGQAGAGLRQRAADFGSDAVERAKTVAERTIDAAKTAAVESGEDSAKSRGAENA